MSRIGILPISVPEGVSVTLTDTVVTITGPKGTLQEPIVPHVKVAYDNNQITVSRTREDGNGRALHGLMRSLLANAVEGVTKGFEKQLEIKGVGYRAKVEGNTLVLTIGFSHLVEYQIPNGIQITVKGPKLNIVGIDKHLVGETAACIRRIRPPDAYKGKGIRYVGEIVHLKPGKAAKAAGAKA